MAEFNGGGMADSKLLKKLKHLKNVICYWRDELRNREGEEKDMCLDELEKMEERDLMEEELWVRLECKRRIDDFKRKDLKQLSRVKWALDGDENTEFFHGLIYGRKCSNSLPVLLVDNVWIEKPKIIKKKVMEFFKYKYKEDVKERPKILAWSGAKLSDADADSLVSTFTREEILRKPMTMLIGIF